MQRICLGVGVIPCLKSAGLLWMNAGPRSLDFSVCNLYFRRGQKEGESTCYSVRAKCLGCLGIKEILLFHRFVWWGLHARKWSHLITILPKTISVQHRLCLHHFTTKWNILAFDSSGLFIVRVAKISCLWWLPWNQRWHFRKITFNWQILWW